jgi:hypothetical protein
MTLPSATSLLPLLPKLSELFRSALDHYAICRATGADIDADLLGAFLELKAADWNPVVGGKRLLDDPKTKAAGCRFLAGVAFSLASAAAPQPAQQR